MAGPALAPASRGGDTPDEVSLIELLNVPLRHRWLIIKSAFWVALTLGAIRMLWPASYTTTAEFTPQAQSSSSTLSSLSGLAAQLGVSVPSLSSGVTPDLYVNLLTTPDFLRPVVQARYAFTDDGVRWNASYIDLYDFDDDTPGKTVDDAITYLLKHMSVSDDPTSGVVTVSIESRWPALSQLVAAKLLSLVDDFNVSTRQQQAKALETFSDQRLEQAQRELNATEDSLARFQERNRDYANSPMLALEYNRLQRSISLKQTVYVNLVQTYEQARIDAVRNTPSLVVVQPPLLPLRADKKHMLMWAALGVILGTGLGTGLAFLFFIAEQSRRSDPENVAEFTSLIRAIPRELRHLPRRLLGWLRFRRLRRGVGETSG